ncbi:SHOCT domain-containing protein [Citromicrobium bathyomarinum]|jgi:putative membrane protein
MSNFLNAVFLPATSRVQQGFGWHMNDGGHMSGNYWGMGGFVHVFFWVLVVGAIIAVTLLLSRSFVRKDGGESTRDAIDHLDERYAKGEIDREDYLQRKKDITER